MLPIYRRLLSSYTVTKWELLAYAIQTNYDDNALVSKKSNLYYCPFQVIKSVNNIECNIQVEVSLKEKLNKFTNAVNSCDFSNEFEYLVAAGRL